MGEAKRRKELGISPREKPIDLPKLDKESIRRKVRSSLYKYPIIAFIFYGAAILAFIVSVIYVIKFYKFI